LLRLEDRDGGIERLREARTAWEGMGANARIEQIDQILAQAQPRTVD